MMQLIRRVVTVAAVSTLALTGGALAATAAEPNQQDADWLVANTQTDLAEITLGNLALQKAQTDEARELAQKTKSDHETALAKVQEIAQAKGVDLPSEPNDQQKAVAAQLEAASADDFDLLYGHAQVTGHLQSIAGTEAEIANGSDEDVVGFAKVYLPIAQGHLEMAQMLVSDLGGSAPTAVPAGTGGQAAQAAESFGLPIAVTAAGLIALLTGLVLFRRRRTS
ncbi:DUF4142 domain-containing protein [Nakamurella endophytica]|uniref:DUF4142 domain-containing protein n=1 Tax=Nakamurella endophytica TaxID=1748367 RepID=A0A917WD35_9ACTN|nr:DUF4142 domain-containing protein [Nakamurella endophytica]GGL91591.1 hypothetical protein GCM10011594_09190 [Nakamurella endophytica]